MKSPFLSISLSLLFLPVHYLAGNKEAPATNKIITTSIRDGADLVYDELNLSAVGLSQQAFKYAYKGYQYLLRKNKLNSSAILSVCDMSQSSRKKRFYILDLSEQKVLMTSYVAHGRGSGGEFATRFSNRANSHASSLGFYITGSTYYGEHGLSLRLQGVERGFNDQADRRNIVVHGAEYITPDHLDGNPFMGRSYGCPAVPQGLSAEIINMIKNGSCLFIYHPTKTYLTKSKILND